MIYLAKPSSFDIKFDNINHELTLGEGVKYEDVLEGTLDYVRPCLLNPDLDVPIHLYRVYQNMHLVNEPTVSSDGKIEYDLLLMPPNVTGVEYVKTHGHQMPTITEKATTYPIIIEMLYGSGTFLFQRFNDNFDPLIAIEPEISEVYMVKAPKGSKLVVPPGFYYTLINTRSTYLATGRLHYMWSEKSERSKIEEKQGFSYFVIRKNARQEVVRNPRYKNVPRLQKLKPEQTMKMAKIKSAKPLVTILRNNPEKFDFLSKPWKYDWTIG